MDPEQGAYLLEHGRFEISVLVRVQLTRDTKPTEELGHKDISDSDRFLIWECIRLGPFTKIVCRNEDVLVTMSVSGKGPRTPMATRSMGSLTLYNCSRAYQIAKSTSMFISFFT